MTAPAQRAVPVQVSTVSMPGSLPPFPAAPQPWTPPVQHLSAVPALTSAGARPVNFGLPHSGSFAGALTVSTGTARPASRGGSPSDTRAFGAQKQDLITRHEEERPVEVLLSKGAGQRFGFANVPMPDGKSLVISWIDDQGICAQWNREHPNDAVAEGDRIASVNGASNGIQVMRDQLQQNTVRMLIHRQRSVPG